MANLSISSPATWWNLASWVPTVKTILDDFDVSEPKVPLIVDSVLRTIQSVSLGCLPVYSLKLFSGMSGPEYRRVIKVASHLHEIYAGGAYYRTNNAPELIMSLGYKNAILEMRDKIPLWKATVITSSTGDLQTLFVWGLRDMPYAEHYPRKMCDATVRQRADGAFMGYDALSQLGKLEITRAQFQGECTQTMEDILLRYPNIQIKAGVPVKYDC